MQIYFPDYKGRITSFHVVVVLLSLSLTLSAWQFSKHQVEARILAQFETSRDRTLEAIRERMTKYEDALWAGVAAVESHGGEISYEDWHKFAETLRIQERYPGINGIGLIHNLAEADLPAYLAQQQRIRPNFTVFPEHQHPDKMPITFIEPEASNAAAIGLDIAHEANRRAAAILSRNTGNAQITGPITLVQDAQKTPGFLFYAPFYQGAAPQTVQDRENQFTGAVYAPFVVYKLMQGLLAKNLRDVHFSIRDGDMVIYDEHAKADASIDPTPLFSEKVTMQVYGRPWVIDMRSDRVFRQQHAAAQPTIILIAGLMIEGLIISLLLMMAQANKKAIRYAERMTTDLQKESAQLAETNLTLTSKNEELEEYAYVASHDLRTPIRGIGGLTEMVEEDLEEYFASSNANPDVAANLTRIQERVSRMQELTHGILEFSNATADAEQSAPLNIIELTEALRCDFALSDSQLDLKSDVTQIQIEPIYFRRVVENLVSNAIKYHDNQKPLQIQINVDTDGMTCRVSIMDNGPGIDPKFHDRIFSLFQTLADSKAQHGTGIGLAIVKKLVARHGGVVSLRSTPGNGATFSFDWPLVAASYKTTPIEKAA